MKSFELQTYKNGQWTIKAVFSDQDVALIEAEQCVEDDTFFGVRVIEENYSDATNKAQVRTIFSGGLIDKPDKASLEEENAARRQRRLALVESQKEIESASGTRNVGESHGVNYIKITLFLFLIVMAGLAALSGLQEYFLSR